jgi:hypothetical protein
VINVRWLIPVRSGLCTSAQLGGFITSLPTNMRLNDTSIYTTPLKFSSDSFPTTPEAEAEPTSTPQEGKEEGGSLEEEGEILDNMDRSYTADDRRRQWDIIESITNGVKGASSSSSGEVEGSASADLISENEESGERQDEGAGGGAVYEVPQYTGPVHYKVRKTGYYCVGTYLYSIFLHSIYSIPSLIHSNHMWEKIGMKLIIRNRTRNIIEPTNYQFKTSEPR